MVGNSPTGWGSVSRSFHWILGLTIIAMIAHGWWMNHITARPDRFLHRSIHSDIGYVVLLLTAIRLIWRSVNPVPELPDDMVRRLRIAARATHWALYLAWISHATKRIGAPNQRKLFCENDFARFEERPDADRV